MFTKSEATIPTLIYATWSVLLAAYTNLSYVTLRIVRTGRHLPVLAIEDIIGTLFTQVPLHVRVDPSVTVSQLLTLVHQEMSDTMPFVLAGWNHIRSLSAAATAALDAAFLVTVQPRQLENPPGPALGLKLVSGKGMSYHATPFYVDVFHTDSTVRLVSCFDKSYISEEQMQKLMGQFEAVFNRLSPSDDEKSTLYDVMKEIDTSDREVVCGMMGIDA